MASPAVEGLASFSIHGNSVGCGATAFGCRAERALSLQQDIVLVAQKDHTVDEPDQDDLYAYGTLATIKQVVNASDGEMRIVVQGKHRVQIDTIESTDDVDVVHGQIVDEIDDESDEQAALVRMAIDLFGEYASFIKRDQDRIDTVSPSMPPGK